MKHFPSESIVVLTSPIESGNSSHHKDNVKSWLRTIVRIARTYRRIHGRWPSLLLPRRYSEKIQWRKLFDLEPCYTVLADKIGVRDYINRKTLRIQSPPCLWFGENPNDIPFDALMPPYVIKSAHGCGDTIIVQGALTAADKRWIAETSRSWLDHCHGSLSNEPAYVNVPRRLVIERLLKNSDGTPPLEIKAFVFHGRVETFQVIHVDPQSRERFRAHFSREWERLDWSVKGESIFNGTIDRPTALLDLIDIAENLSDGTDHLRVDTYVCDERIYVGELTLYSQSGLAPFQPDYVDLVLGGFWRIKHPLLSAARMLLSGRRRAQIAGMRPTAPLS